jgi:hypothetical protein
MSTLTATTSSTNPSLGAGDVGKSYFETDTNKILVWDGTAFLKYETDSAIGGAYSNRYAIDFDGTNDYLQSSSTSQSYTLGTLSLWFKPDSTISSSSSDQALVGFNSDYHSIILGSATGTLGNEVVMIMTPSVNYAYTSTTASISTDWHHLVVVWDSVASEYKIYLDNVQVKNAQSTGTPAQMSVDDVMIGYRDQLGGYFDGKIDEVSIFSTSLTTAQITTMYNSGVPSDISSLSPLSWWRMLDSDGGTGSSVTDDGSLTNNMTLVNSPTIHDLSVAPDSIYVA